MHRLALTRAGSLRSRLVSSMSGRSGERFGKHLKGLMVAGQFGLRTTATSICRYRIFQECMTNVIRHAQAKSVRVALSQEDENIVLVVEDDGIGFSESNLSNSFGSLGLLGMKERAQFCGGDVQISSSPDNGTTVTVRVALDIPRSERSEVCTS